MTSTENSCWPAVRLVYVRGDVHGRAGAPSSEHSIAAPGTVLAKANVAVVESVGSAGAWVKSTPMPIDHSCSCQASSRLPLGSVARTAKTWSPRVRPV